jgi:hypothetical protein
VWFLGANFQWGIIDYPRIQLKRDLLFGISDVLGELMNRIRWELCLLHAAASEKTSFIIAN